MLKKTLAALAASGAVLVVAAPALSQQEAPTCLGQPATNPGSLTGTSGDDVIIGTLGADRISGGGGNDTICGEPDGSTSGSADVIDAGAGSDVVDVRDRKGDDTVKCGSGRDVVTADRKDKIARDCEVVRRK